MNEAEITCGSFVVACRQPTREFGFVEASLDPVPQCVDYGLEEGGFFAIDLARYDRGAPTLSDDLTDVIAVIAPVSDEHSGFGQIGIDQRIKPFEVRHFSTAYLRPDRQSVSVGNEMDLGREATL